MPDMGVIAYCVMTRPPRSFLDELGEGGDE